MKDISVQLVTPKGIPVKRQFIAEIVRRTEERMAADPKLPMRAAMEAAVEECVKELEDYAAMLGPEHHGAA